MPEQTFRELLAGLGLNAEEIEASFEIAEELSSFLSEPGRTRSAQTAWAFSRLLISDGRNTEANYLALVRYCRFIKEHELTAAFLELVDGGEVGDNLYRMVGERFGAAIRNEVFHGIGVAPYGTPSPQKPGYLQPVIRRLEQRVGTEACRQLLSSSLRDLPDEYYEPEREKLRRAGNVDAYLRQRKESFLAELEACLREGRLFYAQEITPAVIDFVRNDTEMGGGRREGGVIYETKIPYMTARYLATTDPQRKRYYACHCPWAREAILTGEVEFAETFCQCSAGFHKKPLEAALGRPFNATVLESALRGDTRCRFAFSVAEEPSVR